MPFPTTNATQELPAVNQILASVGQAPVTTLDQTNPDVAIAYDTLLQVSREVQAEGWTFNTEYKVVLTPDTNDEIVYTNQMLQVNLSDGEGYGSKAAIRKNGKLYDRVNHTDKWTDETVTVDIVYQYDWIDLPIPIQDFITARAATIVSTKIVGDPEQHKYLSTREQFARANALEYECNQGNYTYFGHPRGNNNYVSYQPYKALNR
ncbi:MAG: hypothetical protein CL739_08110 [Chloroflexi bacterium]|nr:hypothetical protein [Chloroflexota bacterium]|tara:strand:+ start:556 stop:1173 length:618 start_codon:yes stop_codon:yes gene_type:complete